MPRHALIANPQHTVYVSAATIWEIGIKISIGKLQLPRNWLRAISEGHFSDLAITRDHAAAAAALPAHHRDPFDRMLVAQAMIEQLKIVSRDESIAQYAVTVIGP